MTHFFPPPEQEHRLLSYHEPEKREVQSEQTKGAPEREKQLSPYEHAKKTVDNFMKAQEGGDLFGRFTRTKTLLKEKAEAARSRNDISKQMLYEQKFQEQHNAYQHLITITCQWEGRMLTDRTVYDNAWRTLYAVQKNIDALVHETEEQKTAPEKNVQSQLPDDWKALHTHVITRLSESNRGEAKAKLHAMESAKTLNDLKTAIVDGNNLIPQLRTAQAQAPSAAPQRGIPLTRGHIREQNKQREAERERVTYRPEPELAERVRTMAYAACRDLDSYRTGSNFSRWESTIRDGSYRNREEWLQAVDEMLENAVRRNTTVSADSLVTFESGPRSEALWRLHDLLSKANHPYRSYQIFPNDTINLAGLAAYVRWRYQSR